MSTGALGIKMSKSWSCYHRNFTIYLDSTQVIVFNLANPAKKKFTLKKVSLTTILNMCPELRPLGTETKQQAEDVRLFYRVAILFGAANFMIADAYSPNNDSSNTKVEFEFKLRLQFELKTIIDRVRDGASPTDLRAMMVLELYNRTFNNMRLNEPVGRCHLWRCSEDYTIARADIGMPPLPAPKEASGVSSQYRTESNASPATSVNSRASPLYPYAVSPSRLGMFPNPTELTPQVWNATHTTQMGYQLVQTPLQTVQRQVNQTMPHTQTQMCAPTPMHHQTPMPQNIPMHHTQTPMHHTQTPMHHTQTPMHPQTPMPQPQHIQPAKPTQQPQQIQRTGQSTAAPVKPKKKHSKPMPKPLVQIKQEPVESQSEGVTHVVVKQEPLAPVKSHKNIPIPFKEEPEDVPEQEEAQGEAQEEYECAPNQSECAPEGDELDDDESERRSVTLPPSAQRDEILMKQLSSEDNWNKLRKPALRLFELNKRIELAKKGYDIKLFQKLHNKKARLMEKINRLTLDFDESLLRDRVVVVLPESHVEFKEKLEEYINANRTPRMPTIPVLCDLLNVSKTVARDLVMYSLASMQAYTAIEDALYMQSLLG